MTSQTVDCRPSHPVPETGCEHVQWRELYPRKPFQIIRCLRSGGLRVFLPGDESYVIPGHFQDTCAGNFRHIWWGCLDWWWLLLKLQYYEDRNSVLAAICFMIYFIFVYFVILIDIMSDIMIITYPNHYVAILFSLKYTSNQRYVAIYI